MKIVVIGGGGLIGSRLVEQLNGLGHEALAAFPDVGIDTITGEGLSDALSRASTVVDVSNSPARDDASVRAFFETSTRNILAAEAAAGVGHHVALSIVGTDRLPDSGHYCAKLAQEQLIASSSIPYSIIRSTQFYEFVPGIAQASTDGDTVRVAPVIVQPIAADEVAGALGRVALDPPLNGMIEIAGPEQFRLDDLVRRVLGARDDPRRVIADPTATYFGGRLAEDTLVPAGPVQLAGLRFEDWLSQSLLSRSPS